MVHGYTGDVVQQEMNQVSPQETVPGSGSNRASVVYNAATGNRNVPRTPHRRQAAMAANSLRPQIVQVMAAHRERPLTTTENYQHVAASCVAGFDPKAKRDRNLVNRELSDLAGMRPESHGKPTPRLLARVGRGRYIFREPELPMGLALVREYLEPEEVYEKRPPRGRRSGTGREGAPEVGADGPLRGQRGVCPGCGIYLPHFMRFEVDHIVALADDG